MQAPADGRGDGALYFCVGRRYLDEAIRSARSLKRHMPDLRVAIACDEEVPPELFDLKLPLEPGLPVKRQKMQALLRTPFARTVFLDTDTLVADPFWELFDLLDRFELAVALSPWWRVPLGQPRGDTFDRGVPVAFPKVNSGVIAFRDSPAVRELVLAWDRLHLEWGGQGQDQDPLRVALFESSLRWATLPPAYNYRLPFPAAIRGGVKIFHGRHPDLAGLSARINRTADFRVTLPLSARKRVLLFGPESAEPPAAERPSPLAGLRRKIRKLLKRLGRAPSA